MYKYAYEGRIDDAVNTMHRLLDDMVAEGPLLDDYIKSELRTVVDTIIYAAELKIMGRVQKQLTEAKNAARTTKGV